MYWKDDEFLGNVFRNQGFVEEYDNQTSYLLGEQIDHFEMEDSLYKPGSIQSGATQAKKPETTVLKTVAPVKLGDNKQEDYLAEIESLRARLREKEQENRHLKEQMHTAKATYDEQEVLLKKYQGERNIPFGYLTNVNLESLIRQIYEEIE